MVGGVLLSRWRGLKSGTRRYNYDPDEVLGPKRFRIDGRLFERVDLEVMKLIYAPKACVPVPHVNFSQVMNERRQRLKCSHYMPVLEGNRAGQTTKFPCVIYCHGNCGSRVDARSAPLSALPRVITHPVLTLHAVTSDCLDLLLPQNISVFAFDFSGSGLSDGKLSSPTHAASREVTPGLFGRRDNIAGILRAGRPHGCHQLPAEQWASVADRCCSSARALPPPVLTLHVAQGCGEGAWAQPPLCW